MGERIARLSEEVINQIAAGEVVENPASVVKELIENSLDARASRIETAIEGGGQELIQVEDDGCGMSREDSLLCLQRYATSKMKSVDDLQTLKTMGFRGEALAAIAAVSRLELRTSEGGEGTRVGQWGLFEPCARNRGTSVFVRSLFYNVPARKKFQKSPSTNAAQVARIVETLALARPDVAFSLHSQKERVFCLEPQGKRERIEAILGPFRHEVSSGRLWGLLAAPEEARAQRRGQKVFVNGRPIFSPLIARAVQAGYGTRLAEHAYPPFVLFLEIPQDEVDINVHPQKKEVRFCDEGKIFRLVERSVASAFETSFSFSEPVAFCPLPSPSFSLDERGVPSFRAQKSLPLSFSDRPLAVYGHFLFLEKESLFLVNLQRAHARILFETLQEKKDPNQALIWPLEIAMNDPEIENELRAIGVECRALGKKMLAIDALPSCLEAADFPQFFNAWKERRKIDQAAVRFCTSSKKVYTLEEAARIWNRLIECKDNFYDPIGRPIWISMDLEKIFSRNENTEAATMDC